MRQAEVITGLFAQFEEFAGLIEGLNPDEWHTPTRCEGWQVCDVAGHVAGNAIDVQTGEIGKRTPDEQARALRGEAPAGLAASMRTSLTRVRPFFDALSEEDWAGPSPAPGVNVGDGTLGLWYDCFLHGDDIRTALGRPSVRGPGLDASLHWVRESLEHRDWGPARIVLDGAASTPSAPAGPCCAATRCASCSPPPAAPTRRSSARTRASTCTPYDEHMSRKVEQGEATRGALVDAAVALFTANGFAGTSTTEIVRRADVTRGALYHHFADKEELFRAAYEAIQQDIFDRCQAAAAARDGVDALKAGVGAYLDACLEPPVQRILLIEGPLVLGWDRSVRFDDPRCARRLLRAAVRDLAPGPPEPLAHLLFGGLLQAGLVIADAPDRRTEMGDAMDALVDSLFEKPARFS